jgi:hypothetical protein
MYDYWPFTKQLAPHGIFLVVTATEYFFDFAAPKWKLQKKITLVCIQEMAQSVQRLATGWTVRGSNISGDEIFRTHPAGPWGPPSLIYLVYVIFPGNKSGRGVALTAHPICHRG